MPPPIRADQDEGLDRSARKRGAILNAATDVFLKGGYLGTNVDAIAAVSGVSKQTVYKHFGSKEALFVEIVARMTNDAGDLVVGETPEPDDSADLAGYLRAYADKQLTVVLTPRLMQLRRLVIGEVSRFPDLAKVLYERGPQRALTKLTAMFERLAARGLLTLDDPSMAASHFNWVIMADPLNRAMLLGDGAIPAADDLRRHVAEGVRVFLAAYATRPSRKQGAPKKTRVTKRPPAITPATHGAVRALEAVSKPPRGGPSTGPRVASGYSRTRR